MQTSLDKDSINYDIKDKVYEIEPSVKFSKIAFNHDTNPNAIGIKNLYFVKGHPVETNGDEIFFKESPF